MSLQDELTKPLGLEQAGPPRQGRLLPVVALLASIGGLVSAGWYLHERQTGPEPVVEKSQAPAPAIKAEAEPSAGAATGKNESVKAEGSAEEAPIVAAVPDGRIIPKIPLPKPRRQESGLAHLPDPELVESGASGVIPKRSAEGHRAMDVYSRPAATEGNFGVARVVIIVGGLGISQSGSQDAVRKLPGAVNLAFAPYGNSLGRWMQEARKAGHEILLQVPMQPFDYPQNNPGPHTLRADASAEENLANLHWAMSRITNYVGVVNFLGGKLLASREAAEPVFNEIASRGLLFVDDGSMANTQSGETANAARLPYARAHVQIDAVRTRRDIAARLDDLARQAKRTGLAIGVASAFPESVDMIAAFAAAAENQGIEITPVSAVVSDPERGKKE